MIRHIVMWKVRGADAATRAHNAARVKAEFETLRGRVPGLLHLEVGLDESGIDYAADVVLLTDFASREALAAYATHPEHLRVRQALGELRTERHQVDYTVDDPGNHPPPAGADSAGTTPKTGDNHVQAL